MTINNYRQRYKMYQCHQPVQNYLGINNNCKSLYFIIILLLILYYFKPIIHYNTLYYIVDTFMNQLKLLTANLLI